VKLIKKLIVLLIFIMKVVVLIIYAVLVPALRRAKIDIVNTLRPNNTGKNTARSTLMTGRYIFGHGFTITGQNGVYIFGAFQTIRWKVKMGQNRHIRL
jgi:hypothetical protein